MESTSRGGLDVHSNRIALLFIIHVRLPLVFALAWGTFKGMCWWRYILLCSCIDIGEDRALVSGGWEKCCYSIVKRMIMMVPLCHFVWTFTAASASGTNIRTTSSIVLLSRCQWCELFVGKHIMCNTHACHNSLRIFLPAVPCENDRCASNSIHVGCASKVHHNNLHVKVPKVTWQW